MTNMLQVQALIESLVTGGADAEKVWQGIRGNEGIRDLCRNPRTGAALSFREYQERIKEMASDFESRLAEAKRRGPLVHAHVRLQSRTAALVGAVMHELSQLELEEPDDIREAAELMMGLEAIQSAAQATKTIREVLDYCEEAGRNVTDLRNEFIAVFPVKVKGE